MDMFDGGAAGSNGENSVKRIALGIINFSWRRNERQARPQRQHIERHLSSWRLA
jgi:hypothetical protein